MLVSVIMPTFNTPYEFLSEAIDSVLKQTYPDFELIIIDDSSTEYNDSSFWNSLKEKDPRIVLLQNTHTKGVAGALNTGIDFASGKYLFRMDADDVCFPNRIETQVKYMDMHPNVIVSYGKVRYFGDKNSAVVPCKSGEDLQGVFLFECNIIHPSVCIRRSFLIEHNLRYREDVQNEDYSMWLKMSLIDGCDFGFVNSFLIRYRIHTKQVTKTRLELLYKNGVSARSEYYLALSPSMSESDAMNFAKFCLGLPIKEKRLYSLQKRVYELVKPHFDLRFKRFARLYWWQCFKRALLYGIKNKRLCFGSLFLPFWRALFRI